MLSSQMITGVFILYNQLYRFKMIMWCVVCQMGHLASAIYNFVYIKSINVAP